MFKKFIAISLALITFYACENLPSELEAPETTLDVVPAATGFVTPTNGQIVSGLVPIKLVVEDPRQVRQVRFNLEDDRIYTDDVAPYEFVWDSKTVPDSPYQLNAQIRFRNGGPKIISIRIDVKNAGDPPPPPPPDTVPEEDTEKPTITITSPLSGDNVNGAITIKAVASDNVGVDKVKFYLNHNEYAIDSVAPYETVWNATQTGNYVLSAIAMDKAGNQANSSEVNVTVGTSEPPPPPADTVKPSIVITHPFNGNILVGVVTISANASDNVGIKNVVFSVGTLSVIDSVAPYETNWNTLNFSDGDYTITATATDVNSNMNSASVAVSLKNSIEPPPPPIGDYNRVVNDTLITGDLIIPANEKCLIGSNVRVAGNVLVKDATFVMRPGSTLTFLGADPSRYVGGGNNYGPEFANDIGLWVWGTGSLDISCTPKTSWNRTGIDPSWLPTDEYWISPTAVRDWVPRRWVPGQSIPRIDARLPAAEIANVTRDCSVVGPGHIHVNSSRPSRVEYVRLEGLGISHINFTSIGHWGDPALSGRYALHFHMQGEGSRGSVVRGVAAVNSKGRVYVPHTSHGVTYIDNVSVNSYAEGFWWDLGHATNNVLVDRLAVFGVSMPWEVAGRAFSHDAIVLPLGDNMVMRNSVAAGAAGSDGSHGFDWPEVPVLVEPQHPADWVFQDNVAHNNEGSGARFWNNSVDPHFVQGFVSYHNNANGIENGAYLNINRYANVLLYKDGWGGWFGSYMRAAVLWGTNYHGQLGPNMLTGIAGGTIIAAEGPAIAIGSPPLPSDGYVTFSDLVLIPAPGHPKVLHLVGTDESHFFPRKIHFIRVNVTPDDIVHTSMPADGSHFIIENADGSGWDIRIQNGQRIVTQR